MAGAGWCLCLRLFSGVPDKEASCCRCCCRCRCGSGSGGGCCWRGTRRSGRARQLSGAAATRPATVEWAQRGFRVRERRTRPARGRSGQAAAASRRPAQVSSAPARRRRSGTRISCDALEPAGPAPPAESVHRPSAAAARFSAHARPCAPAPCRYIGKALPARLARLARRPVRSKTS
jgi:hypothetical protein